ncbi:MAG: ABC transporter permease [Brevundimonas sp.]|uniref:ABC transporter permease n=1 Tax=Brevundimonas sp. TaxID=1871086 RepID=UPI00271EBC53|nr:ABC transporter permease [Brevundimonas sp.]MDO9588685.1 ABC transporter permease [Brevundimonas sp.]MDP2765390.1 ABC transporter permease [Brevundimonas sp.]MDP3368464.1 ABC transporter permease [Brevundimonas sp.]MDP3658399.1 ABC transporter permease [Brevundimonas sp.]MDZ4111322.1 ABC transporter permease [Brevundimonas sp.]
MSLALSTLLYEWRRYMAAVMALALSGLLVLAMTGVFIGIGKGFTAQIERSSADIIVMQPGAKSLGGGPSGVPRRFIPLVYNHPDVVEVRPLAGGWGQFQNIKNVDQTMSAAERARQGAPRQQGVQVRIIDTSPGAVTIPVDYSEELIDALRQPYAVAIDETSLRTLGVELGDRALFNGQTVRVAAVTRGYPNMMQPIIVMSRDSLRMLGQTSDSSPQVGPLMVALKDPSRSSIVATQLNVMGGGNYKAWTRQELADANQNAMFEEGILVIIIGGCVVLGTIIGVAITWQTLRGAIMANIKEFASLRALGVGMGSLNRIVMELSFWVGIVGVAAAIFLTWLVQMLAMANAVIIALPPALLIVVGGGLIVISMLSGLLSLGILKNSQPADLLR